MPSPLDSRALEQVFLDARSTFKFTDEPVSDETLHTLYELCKWGPTAMNTQPMRLVFVRSAAGQQRLEPALSPGNIEKTRSAPVTAIVAIDRAFYEQLPVQFPVNPEARQIFTGNPALAQETAFRNSTLQGAYLMMAARMLGLAAGPMSGFDSSKLDAEFFADGRWTANFLVNLGYPHPEGHYPRGPRLAFDEAVRLA